MTLDNVRGLFFIVKNQDLKFKLCFSNLGI